MKPKLSIKLFLLALNLTRNISFGKKLDIVFCYHDISDDGWEFSVTKAQFDSHIRAIRSVANLVSIEEIISTSNNSGKPRVAITFDDGYLGVYKNALSVLKKHNAVGCVFVLGNKNTILNKNMSSKLMNDDQISLLKDEGWEIGWHTNTHPNLKELSDAELEEELHASKSDYERESGMTIKYFAYPSGKYNRKVRKAAESFGYKAAFTVDGGFLSGNTDKFLLNRITVNKYIDQELVKRFVSPAGVFVNKLFTTAWKLGG